MTYEQLIQAWSCCDQDKSCIDCPLQLKASCADILSCESIALFRRFEAEIEKWQEQFRYLDFECDRLEKEEENNRMEIEKLNKDLMIWKDIAHREIKYVGMARAEAIREFAERVKELNSQNLFLWDEQIDRLVEEMVGDNNGC